MRNREFLKFIKRWPALEKDALEKQSQGVKPRDIMADFFTELVTRRELDNSSSVPKPTLETDHDAAKNIMAGLL